MWVQLLFELLLNKSAVDCLVSLNKFKFVKCHVLACSLARAAYPALYLCLELTTLGLFWPDVVAKGVLHVDEACVSAVGNLLDSVKVLLAQLGDEPVALDALGGGALGQDDVAALEAPCEQHLCEVVAAALGHLVELCVCAHLLAGAGHLVLGAERRVGGHHDVVVLAELDELRVGQEGVDLDLVDHGLDLCEAEQLLEAVNGPVGDANGLCLARLVNLLHGPPGRLWVLGEVLFDDVLAVGPNLGHVLVVALGGNGPVDEEGINVVHAQLLQALVDAPFDLAGLVEVVPYLCADEEVLAGDAGVLAEKVAHGVAHLVLVLVEPGAVKVAVARLERRRDGCVRLAGCTLAGKGAEADGGDGEAVGELEGLLVGEGGHGGGGVSRGWK